MSRDVSGGGRSTTEVTDRRETCILRATRGRGSTQQRGNCVEQVAIVVSVAASAREDTYTSNGR